VTTIASMRVSGVAMINSACSLAEVGPVPIDSPAPSGASSVASAHQPFAPAVNVCRSPVLARPLGAAGADAGWRSQRCGSGFARLQRAWWTSDISGTWSGRGEGIAVGQVLGQTLRKAARYRLGMLDELATDADNSMGVQCRTRRGLGCLSSRSKRHGLVSTPRS
jgi:hypothetical protein